MQSFTSRGLQPENPPPHTAHSDAFSRSDGVTPTPEPVTLERSCKPFRQARGQGPGARESNPKSLEHMERVQRETIEMSEDDLRKPVESSSAKIALVPFAEARPPVHLLDAAGNTFPARDRCPEDDFRLAVQSIGIGHDNADDNKGDDAGSEAKECGGEGNKRPQGGSVMLAETTSKLENSAGDGEATTAGGTTSSITAASPPEHPLQKAITSFDMALGELNQLVHLVDLARAGEFMALKRVTPSEEDQARAMPDQSARPGNGVPREALSTMVKLKRNQLNAAADKLRQRAKRLRETTQVQRVFQQGVVHLRKSWRIVAPNHGKVNVPLQVGEALSVDCSFGSAGGHSVPLTAAAGTRHRHPWLFQLTCGEGGRLEVEPAKVQSLKAFEVQLVSAVTGVCDYSLRASFPAKRGRCDGRGAAEAKAEVLDPPSASNGEEKSHIGDRDSAQMDRLEHHISRLHHSVFWEEVFATIKADALVDGKDGWLAHQDARRGSGTVGSLKAPVTLQGPARIQAGTKRRFVSLSSRGTAGIAGKGGARVVHVMDDEVMVELDDRYLLGYRLVSGETGSQDSSDKTNACVAFAEGSPSAEEISQGSDEEQLELLCQLALLYCGSLIRQKQQIQAAAGCASGSKTGTGWGEGARPSSVAAENGMGSRAAVGHSSAASTWKAVGRVLLHHLFRAEVVRSLAGVSRSLLRIGLPLDVRWTHAEATYPASALSLTLGHCFHCRASLDDGCGIVVSALPGLHNHADQRSVELQTARDLRQFLLGEVCRQVVLTFGDIVSSWTTGIHQGGACFRIELVPPVICLLPALGAKEGPKGSVASEESRSGVEVHVCADEAGVRIACSKWPSVCCTSKKQGVADELGDSKSKISSGARDPDSFGVAAPEVTAAEWDRLEGRDLFRKFYSLLACVYPLQDS